MLKSFRGQKPRIDDSAFIAETSSIVGDVEIGPRASVWYGVAIRGDINTITIGEETNIQEGAVVHVDSPETRVTGGRTVLGKRVTVGHGAILHACVIGMGAIVLSGARIGEGSLVAAGSLVREGQEFPPGSMIAGNPAMVKKTLSAEQKEAIRASARHYVALAEEHRRNSPL